MLANPDGSTSWHHCDSGTSSIFWVAAFFLPELSNLFFFSWIALSFALRSTKSFPSSELVNNFPFSILLSSLWPNALQQMNNGFILPLSMYLYVISWNIFASQAGTKAKWKTLMELQNKPPPLGNFTSNFVCFILIIMYFKMFMLEAQAVAEASFHAFH